MKLYIFSLSVEANNVRVTSYTLSASGCHVQDIRCRVSCVGLGGQTSATASPLQGYLALKKTPPPLGPP